MKIKNQVTLSLLAIIASISTASAQTQPTSPSVDRRIQKLEQLQREEEIKDFIEKEVESEIDRSVGEKFERTTGLLDANLTVLNFWLIVAPVLVTIAFIFFRQMILKEWVSHTKKQLEEELQAKQDYIKIELQNYLDRKNKEIKKIIIEEEHEMYKDMKINLDEIEQQLRKQLTNQLEVIFKDVKEHIQEKVENIEESILEDILSDAQIKKANIFQQLSILTPSLWKIPDTNQPDIQHKIQLLTKQLEELKAKNPQLFFTVDDYLKQGDALFFEGRYEDAIVSYDKVIKKQPLCYLAWASRGWALRRLARYEEALQSYEKAIDIKPKDNLGWYGKANALRELQRYDEAIVAYDQSLNFNSTFEWAWYRKARCYLLKGDINQALENLAQAIKLNPDQLCQIAKNDGDWDVIRDSDRFKMLIGQ